MGGRTDTEEPGAAPTHLPATAWSRKTSDPLEMDGTVSCRICERHGDCLAQMIIAMMLRREPKLKRKR